MKPNFIINPDVEFGVVLCLGSVAVVVAFHFLFPKKSRSQVVNRNTKYLGPSSPQKELNGVGKLARKKQRKEDFLKCYSGYGYRNSPCGYIDSWRKQEYPSLIPPENPVVEDEEVYLDHAGAALPSISLLDSIHKDAVSSSSVLANPHSSGPAASRTLRLIEETKKLISDHFHLHPGRFSTVRGVDKNSRSNNNGSDHFHPGYEIVFTSGATNALQIVAEHFPWSNNGNQKNPSKSILLYPHNAHTSVVGMRGPVLAKRGNFVCRNLNEIMKLEDDSINLEKTLDQWAHQSNEESHLVEKVEESPGQDRRGSNGCSTDPAQSLLVIPTECNFGGDKVHVKALLKRFRRLQQSDRANGKKRGTSWFTMLDLAKASSTSPVNLKELDPDFACVSFYKIFGAPTGLGALFVRRSAINQLVRAQQTTKTTTTAAAGRPNPFSIHRYFGGGAVDIVLSGADFAVGRNLGDSSSLGSQQISSSSLASLGHGTLDFRGIVALRHGFIHEIQRLGGMEQIQGHTESLAKELCRRLKCLRHSNGHPVIVLYGAWGQEHIVSPGPVVAFNIVRSDGSVVGYNEVAKVAALNQPPLQLRAGCFCNPGACQEALQFTDKEMIENYTNSGHVCGDEIDIVNRRPTGALRASFGSSSLWEDLDALVLFIQNHFVTSSVPSRRLENSINIDGPKKAIVTEILIYPIKSCASQSVSRWGVCSSDGRLEFDREFALVDSFGTAMRLQRYPKMGYIRPEVDPARKTLKVGAPNMQDLILKLDWNDGSADMSTVVSVCGNQCSGKVWGDIAVSEWFSSYLGVQCWLARQVGEGQYAREGVPRPLNSRHAFSNDKPILLISKHAVDNLNAVLMQQNQPLVSSKHFRPNLVIDWEDVCDVSSLHHPEDSWKSVEVIGCKLKFTVEGLCARCSMVDVDPATGTRGKTLRALAEYRRNNSQIYFGIFLRLWDGTEESQFLHRGSEVICM